jgi:3-deoxy-7-phosphoheptulonate synthase
VVDCSHGNSNKDPGLQSLVAENVANQILEGNSSIVGLMLESNLHWGSQPIPARRSDLEYGVSVTDACIDWETTEGCCSPWTAGCARRRDSPRGRRLPDLGEKRSR